MKERNLGVLSTSLIDSSSCQVSQRVPSKREYFVPIAGFNSWFSEGRAQSYLSARSRVTRRLANNIGAKVTTCVAPLPPVNNEISRKPSTRAFSAWKNHRRKGCDSRTRLRAFPARRSISLILRIYHAFICMQ